MNRQAKEETAIVIDFLPNGYPSDTRPAHLKTAIAQAIGIEHFTLLELVPKKGIFLQPNKEVYMGEGKREEIHHISGRINFLKLTQTARMNLEEILKKLVRTKEDRFMEFFNKAGPINARRHQLELIPGIGKKHMWEILEKREEREFDSFEDIKNRVKLMPDPENAIIKRIIAELNEEDKYKLFAGV
jgi:putative nucleotide binding protein